MCSPIFIPPLLGFRRLVYESVAYHENMRFAVRQVSCTWHSASRNVTCDEQECDKKVPASCCLHAPPGTNPSFERVDYLGRDCMVNSAWSRKDRKHRSSLFAIPFFHEVVNYIMSSFYKITGKEMILRLRSYGIWCRVIWHTRIVTNVLVEHCA